ncbi:protein serine/threonine phosphatase 2C [Auricularia subglabra TFB-10046 SS5]|nr:protein serine/threonine phosphatase 2C [Auricularia subglabra TFB-10046 SS5]
MLATRLCRAASAQVGFVHDHFWRQPRALACQGPFTLGHVRHLRSARSPQRNISWITAEQAEAILSEHEGSSAPSDAGPSAISRYDYNIVGANTRCEDTAAYAVIDGRQYYAVFDGHAGRLLSYQLADALIPRVAAALREGRCESDEDTRAAIQRAFVELDDEITRKPMRLVEAGSVSGSPATREKYDRRDLLLSWELATQGSCALLLIVDEARDRMHVAVTGDSRAVMGTRSSSAPHGSWVARVLTEDQTSANPREARRLQAEHPPEEARALVKNGRTLDLGMSRAFGDAWFKWSADEVCETARAIFGREAQPYADCKTPPYITARPEVASLPLPRAPGFVVLASDGLWEWLSNSDVVALVGGLLDGRRVAARVAMAEHSPDAYLPPPFPGGHGRDWVFKDANAATHLIRNAVAGDSVKALQMQYSLPASVARNYRDDMAAVVVVIGDALREAAKGDDIQG